MPTIDCGHWDRQAKPPAPPCWINRLASRWGRRFRLPVEADFHRSERATETPQNNRTTGDARWHFANKTAILNDDLAHVSTDLLIRILGSLGYRVRVSVTRADTAFPRKR